MSGIHESYAIGLMFGITGIITVPIQLAMTISLAYNIYHDFYTPQRKSVSHRRNPPELTKQYKIINSLTLCCLVIYNLYTIGEAVKPASKSVLACVISTDTQATGNLFGKNFMYLVLFARLYAIYEKSSFSYSLKCIRICAIVVTVYNVIVAIFYCILFQGYLEGFGNGMEYPNFCGAVGVGYSLSGAAIILEDLICAIGFLVAFIVPLNKTRKAIEDQEHDNNEKILRKIMFAGTKTKVLTMTAVFSTFSLIIIAVVTNLTFIIALDPIMNCLCLILMTSYYPDITYYQRLCCCCIACCDCKGESKLLDEEEQELKKHIDDHEDTTDQRDLTITKTVITNTTSVDTMSQLRVAAETETANAGMDKYKPAIQETIEVTPQPNGNQPIADNNV